MHLLAKHLLEVEEEPEQPVDPIEAEFNGTATPDGQLLQEFAQFLETQGLRGALQQVEPFLSQRGQQEKFGDLL
jgi:hypothetical protein